jgi:hypothetical protein
MSHLLTSCTTKAELLLLEYGLPLVAAMIERSETASSSWKTESLLQ